MKILVLSALSAALIATAGLAGAASTPPAPPESAPGHPGMMRGGRGDAIGPMFKEMDTNGDGKVARAEIQSAGDKRFDAADANRDGKLSQAEVEAAREAARAERRAAMFKRWDKDGDGVLSKEESVGRALARFDAVDTNRDGMISDEERKAARAERRSKRMETDGNR